MEGHRLQEGQELIEKNSNLVTTTLNCDAAGKSRGPSSDQQNNDESDDDSNSRSNSRDDSNNGYNDEQDQEEGSSGDKAPDGEITLKMSASLHRRLCTKAQQEGVKINDFAVELLAEGLVLRAWEIMERKNHLQNNRPGNQQQGQSQGGRPQHNNNRNFRDNKRGHHNNNNNTGGGGRGRGGMSQNRYNTLMEDKAEFLEYVRNQEKKQR